MNARTHRSVQRRGGQRAGGGLLGRAAGGDAGIPHLLGAVAEGRVFGPRGRPARVLGVRREGLGAPVPAPLGDPPPEPAGVQGALNAPQHPCHGHHVRVVRGAGVEVLQTVW